MDTATAATATLLLMFIGPNGETTSSTRDYPTLERCEFEALRYREVRVEAEERGKMTRIRHAECYPLLRRNPLIIAE